jgi:hypothetical protein
VHYYSPAAFTPEQLGQWTHLAVDYDRFGAGVTHYVNGKPLVPPEPILLDTALRIGNAEIGNWDIANRKHNHPIRYLTGCLDEFLLFGRALSDQEIEQHYLHGRVPL